MEVEKVGRVHALVQKWRRLAEKPEIFIDLLNIYVGPLFSYTHFRAFQIREQENAAR